MADGPVVGLEREVAVGESRDCPARTRLAPRRARRSALPDLSAPQPTDPLPPASDGVELTRLLALARLTAPQALEIGAGVLAEAASAIGGRSAGPPIATRAESLRSSIGADGQVLIGPPPDGDAQREHRRPVRPVPPSPWCSRRWRLPPGSARPARIRPPKSSWTHSTGQ